AAVDVGALWMADRKLLVDCQNDLFGDRDHLRLGMGREFDPERIGVDETIEIAAIGDRYGEPAEIRHVDGDKVVKQERFNVYETRRPDTPARHLHLRLNEARRRFNG